MQVVSEACAALEFEGQADTTALGCGRCFAERVPYPLHVLLVDRAGDVACDDERAELQLATEFQALLEACPVGAAEFALAGQQTALEAGDRGRHLMFVQQAADIVGRMRF